MRRIPVDSSMIYDIGYEPKTEILEIGFQSGPVYQYYEVPPNEYEDFMKAASKGRYFLDNIEPFYAYAKVSRARRR